MSNQYIGYSASGYPYGGYDYINGMMEREKADWEREKELQHQQWLELRQQEWLKYEEDCEKWIKKRYTLLRKREEELTLREQVIAKRGKEVGKCEKALEEETVKVLEQYKRVKKLERQGKRREERIEKAQQQLQYQVNEHFSIVYSTLQLGLKSLSLQTPSESSRMKLPPIPQVESSPSSSSIPPTSSPVKSFRTSLKPAIIFGKPKAPVPILAPHPETALSKEHSPRGCTFPHENKKDTDKFESHFDEKRTLYQMVVEDNGNSDNVVSNSVSSESAATSTPTPSSVKAVKLMSIRPLRLDTVFNKMERATNWHMFIDGNVLEFGLPPERIVSPFWVDKHNPHVDWGPLFESPIFISVVSA
jgi:hypothetical protein